MSLAISGDSPNFTNASLTTPTLTSPTISNPTFTGTTTGSVITSGTAVDSTSGTSIDFTSIPSWVKRITVMFNGVSTSGTSLPIIQLGDAGGIETTGYDGYWWISASYRGSTSSGIVVNGLAINSSATYGQITICLVGSNLWSFNATTTDAGAQMGQICSGSKALSATLDRIRITTVNGTDTFDAGTINILYE